MPSRTNHYHLLNGVKALKASHPEVKRLKKETDTHSAHGNKVWRSSFVLIDYFTTYPPKTKSRVMDIGCGWGFSGIYFAKIFNARVTGVDMDASVEPFLQLQAELNQCRVKFNRKPFQQLTKKQLSDFDILIGADICFWDELTPILFNLLKRAMAAGVKQIVIADPGRPPFWELVDLCTDKLSARVLTRRIEKPVKTTKYLLVLGDFPDEAE